MTSQNPEEIYKQALERLLINQSDYFQGIRSQLTAFQVKLLSSIAWNGFGSYETEFLQKYRLYPTSSVQKAYKRMTDIDILEKQTNQFFISDPFFELWLKQQS